MKIIDAHTHIDYLTHKIQGDVDGCICCSVDEEQWQNLIDIMNDDKNVHGAFGIHPWFIENVKQGFENRLNDLLQTNQNFMVGEIGLDKYKPDIEKQIEFFKIQLDIAIRLKRPIVLHCVGAWDKILHILKLYKKTELPIIIAHAFNESEDIVRNLISNYNVMFSFNNVDNEKIILNIPDENILVETDGKSNIVLKDMVDKILLIKNNMNIGDIIYNNTKRILQNG